MLNASSRLIRITQPPSIFFSSSNSPPPFSSQIGRESTGGIRFHNRTAASTRENVDKMDNTTTKNNPETKEEQVVEAEEGDLIVESFGVDYATRAIEEGFGGVYGGNRPPDDEGDIEIVRGKPPGCDDKSQGSEEKSRHR